MDASTPARITFASSIFFENNFAHASATAVDMALSGDYWNAMILNGVAASATLNTDPGLVGKMIGAGALGASVSGNGPAFAAIARKKDLARVKRQFPKLQGRIITVPVNCKKASVYDL